MAGVLFEAVGWGLIAGCFVAAFLVPVGLVMAVINWISGGGEA